jgi:hypothetical protein
MEIISSEITMGSLECLVAPQSNSVLSVDADDVQDMVLFKASEQKFILLAINEWTIYKDDCFTKR